MGENYRPVIVDCFLVVVGGLGWAWGGKGGAHGDVLLDAVELTLQLVAARCVLRALGDRPEQVLAAVPETQLLGHPGVEPESVLVGRAGRGGRIVDLVAGGHGLGPHRDHAELLITQRGGVVAGLKPRLLLKGQHLGGGCGTGNCGGCFLTTQRSALRSARAGNSRRVGVDRLR